MIGKGLARRAILATPARQLFEPEFVIVGTGRSGTKYIATALTAAGIRTGHEQWWNPTNNRALRLVGDASWCALFNLDGYRGRVFHQTRDPLRVVSSLAGTAMNPEWLQHHRVARLYYDYRGRFVSLTGEPIVDSMRVVAIYLDEAERVSEWTWRLEDVDHRLITELGERLRRPVTPAPTDRAANARPHEPLGWDDLPDGEMKDRILRHAKSYGYV